MRRIAFLFLRIVALLGSMAITVSPTTEAKSSKTGGGRCRTECMILNRYGSKPYCRVRC